MEFNLIEIQVFVSCPGDVEDEKNLIHGICARLNETLRSNNCPVRFAIKDWKNIIGQFGIRSQETINTIIGEYDIYIGIWWMRFGSRTGKVNPATGEEFISGTLEEFTLACERWEKNQTPQIYLFFKNPSGVSNSSQHAQLGEVIKFKEEQMPKGWVNGFEHTDEFKEQVTYLLFGKALHICNAKKIEFKSNILDDNLEKKIGEHKSKIAPPPAEYVSRSVSHYSSLRDKQNMPLIEPKNDDLEKLVLTRKRIVLLGDAGSGKSTELGKLFFAFSDKESPLIPILKRFNTYTPEKGLDEFLPSFWKKIPEDLLLLILDGLDEIQPEHFNTSIRQILDFSDKYPQVRIIISSRTNFYELPVNGASGTLAGFEPYFINDLRPKDVKEYFELKGTPNDAEKFVKEIFDNHLIDLSAKPFFLMLLSEIYLREKELSINRAKLYDLFLLSRINLDESHYKETFEIRDKKHEILTLLEKVALSMEILAQNQISEENLKRIVIPIEFKTLKYCTAFKKQDGQEATWQFEHNNVQEYLAAKALTKLPFERLIQFLAFEPHYKKLIPSWVNTLTFLFSILQPGEELFQKLLQWMLDNEKEIIVKFERDKISEAVRNQIFQGIFNHYKAYDVWISSNKFSDRELAHFSQSEESIKFITDELKDKNNTRTILLNAIHLIGYFKINSDKKSEVEGLILEHIDSYIDDAHFLHAAIYALKRLGITNQPMIDYLMGKLAQRKNQYIRAALYAMLLKSTSLEKYVDYLIEGLEVIKGNGTAEREPVTLFDEEWKLEECIKNIKSASGVKRLVEYISGSSHFDHGYRVDELITSIVDNAVIAYGKDHSVYDQLLEWFIKSIKMLRTEKAELILVFFDKTHTREQAFHQIWKTKEDKERNKSIAIAKLITPELMSFIIDQYNSHDLTNKELESIYYDLGWARNENRDLFEKMIQERTDFELEKPPQIDYEGIRRKKTQEEFNLLFDKDGFLTETIRIFDEQNKDELTFDELFEIRKNNRLLDPEDYYSGVSLRLLRDFGREDQIIKRETVKSWFSKQNNVENYRVYLMYEYLLNHKELIISDDQAKWISDWCFRNINKIDFKKAITHGKDGAISIKRNAIYLWFFMRKLDIKFPTDVLLDMLSFDHHEGTDWVGMGYLIEKVDKRDIDARIIENFKIGIKDSSVFKNHARYAVQNKIDETYSYIIDEIVNTEKEYYNRDTILDIYVEGTKDFEGLKNVLNKADEKIRWSIVRKLMHSNQDSFLISFLLKILNKSEDQTEKAKAADFLIQLQNIDGLRHYVNLLKSSDTLNLDSDHTPNLANLKTSEAIPLLIELLEISYQRELKIDRIDRFHHYVINGFYSIALVSEENYLKVKEGLMTFMEKNARVYKNANYLLHTIERLDEQFYMNQAKSYTVDDVLEKLSRL